MVWPSTVKALGLLVHRISTALALRQTSASVHTQLLQLVPTQWTLLSAVVSQLFVATEDILVAAHLAVMLAQALVGVILVVILTMTAVQGLSTHAQVIPAFKSHMHPTLTISSLDSWWCSTSISPATKHIMQYSW